MGAAAAAADTFSLTFLRSRVSVCAPSRSCNLLFIDRSLSARGWAPGGREQAAAAAAQGAGRSRGSRGSRLPAPRPPHAPGRSCHQRGCLSGCSHAPWHNCYFLPTPPPPSPLLFLLLYSCQVVSSQCHRRPMRDSGGGDRLATGAARFPLLKEWSWCPRRPARNDQNTLARCADLTPPDPLLGPSASRDGRPAWAVGAPLQSSGEGRPRAAKLRRGLEKPRGSLTRGRRRPSPGPLAAPAQIEAGGSGRQCSQFFPRTCACPHPGARLSRHCSALAGVEVWRGRPGHRRGFQLSAAHGHPPSALQSRLGSEAELLPTRATPFGSPGEWGRICTLSVWGVRKTGYVITQSGPRLKLPHFLANKPTGKTRSLVIPGCGVWGK